MDRSSILRALQRFAAVGIAVAAVALPAVVSAADYTLAAPAPSTVSAGTTGMVTIHVKMTPPNGAAGTKAAPTGFMTVLRQGETDPTWCYPGTGTLCFTGSLVNGAVDVHVNVSKLAASPGTLLFQLRNPSTKAPYSNAVAVQVVATAIKVPTPIRALTRLEQDTLPPSAKFAFQGRIVTLAEMREEHKQRLQRFNAASVTGAGARAALASTSLQRSGAASLQVPQTTVTMKPVPQKGTALANVPRDMREFCKAAAATVCLYVPPGTYGVLNATSMFTADFLIDQPTCSADGGSWVTPDGAAGPLCEFFYPMRDVNSFVPGSSPTFDYKFADSCKPYFAPVSDQKGALSITFLPPAPVVFTTGFTLSCVGYAYVK